MTSLYVVNPNFNVWDGYSGWETTTGAINNQLNNNMSDGYYLTDYFWENWNQTPFIGKMYQTLNVPNGVYELSISAFSKMDSQGGSCTYDAYVYANTSMKNVGYTERYMVRTIVTDGVLEIGLGMPVFKQDWVAIDNVRLTYLGESYDLYLEVLNELVDFAANIPSLGTLQEAAINTLDSITVEVWDEVSDDIGSIVVAYEKVSNTLAVAMHSYSNYAQLYSAYCGLGTAIKDCVNTSLREDAIALYNKAEKAYQELMLGNAEVKALIAEIEKMCVALKVPDMSNASDENPIDVTGFISNSKYEEYNNDWSGDGWLMHLDYHNVEFYSKNFYYYQTLTGLPDGMYKVEMQGFYRPGTALGAYNLYAKDDKTKFYAKLFAETPEVKHSTYLQSIMSDASSYMLSNDDERVTGGEYVPNTMGGAYRYFSQGLYQNYIYIYVTGGTLTIGLEKDQLIVDDWTIFTNWSLTYYGENSNHVSGNASGKYTIRYTVDGTVITSQDVAPGMPVEPLDITPEKDGYTFVDWKGMPEIMPANDIAISGLFAINKYLVTFKIGDEVIAADSLEYGATIVAPDAPEKDEHTFNGWGEVAKTVPAGDVTYEGSYTANSYLLTYVVDGEIVQTDSVAYGTAITLLEEPTKEGYTFSGWDKTLTTMPAEDVTIGGTFTVNIYKVYYYVGEELIHTAEVAYGEAIPEYTYEPTGEGDIFEGWIGETYETMPAHDVTYVANITNGIDAMSTDNGQQTTAIYDLTGREVTDTENLKGGVYIVNGRKVVIK